MKSETYRASCRSRTYGHLPLRLWLILFTFQASLPAAFSQESTTSYNFLRLPVSAHVAAVGGDNITLTDDDPALIFHNPALDQWRQRQEYQPEFHDLHGRGQDRQCRLYERGWR